MGTMHVAPRTRFVVCTSAMRRDRARESRESRSSSLSRAEAEKTRQGENGTQLQETWGRPTHLQVGFALHGSGDGMHGDLAPWLILSGLLCYGSHGSLNTGVWPGRVYYSRDYSVGSGERPKTAGSTERLSCTYQLGFVTYPLVVGLCISYPEHLASESRVYQLSFSAGQRSFKGCSTACI